LLKQRASRSEKGRPVDSSRIHVTLVQSHLLEAASNTDYRDAKTNSTHKTGEARGRRDTSQPRAKSNADGNQVVRDRHAAGLAYWPTGLRSERAVMFSQRCVA